MVFHSEGAGILVHEDSIGVPLLSHDQQGKRIVPVAGDALATVSGMQLKELKDRGVLEFIPRTPHRSVIGGDDAVIVEQENVRVAMQISAPVREDISGTTDELLPSDSNRPRPSPLVSAVADRLSLSSWSKNGNS